MKKIVFCALAAFAAHVAFGGYAWYSREINAILAKLPERYYNKLNVNLYGIFSGSIWTPPFAKLNPNTFEFEISDSDVLNVTSYAELNNYGMYDPALSKDAFEETCVITLTDEFGQPYQYYDTAAALFFEEYESKNFATAKTAIDYLMSAFTQWGNDKISETTTIDVDVEKFASDIHEMSESLGKAKDEIKKAVDDTKAAAEKMNNELAQVQENLTKISEEAVYNAQKQIDSAVNDFNSFITSLENAISKGEWDDTMFEASFDELTKSEQDLVDAITQLQQSSQAPEVQNAITIIGGQLTGIRSLKTSLRAAIDAKDMDAARRVLNAARKMSSLYNSRAAVSKVNNRVKELKSKADVLGVLAKAALSTMSEQDDFEASIGKLRAAFSAMFITAMDNFHQINAFLASTNSMEYLNKRKTANSLADFTIDELERWVKISTQEPLFRDEKDENSYETIGRLGMFRGSTYNTILRLIGSTYFMTYMDSEWLGRFMNTYDQGGFRPENIRGFYEQIETEKSHTVTNWYAGHITAPKNWADGKTIIVTNGVFSVKGGSVLAFYGNEGNAKTKETAITIGSGTATNYVSFASADDSNVKVKCEGDGSGGVKITIGVYWR